MTESAQIDERIGAYRVVRTLATGDVSEVLLAKAEGPLGFERVVVLKLLLPEVQADEDQNKMFAREAAAYGRLNHANIVRLYDFFALDATQAKQVPGQPSRYPGQLVMVLEYVEGPTLQRLRRMLKTLGLQLSDAAAIHVAASVFEALCAAHQAVDDRRMPAPVIHRDVNPENVLVSWSAQVKLTDFGMARVAGVNVQSVVGGLRGTQGYMAPEQVAGANVTGRVDVYACAVVLWEMLAKRRAFPPKAMSQIELMRAMEAPALASLDVLRPDLDAGLREAMRRALEPQAEKRRVTAGEMATVLRDVVSSDEGREKLARALTQVRHEPKATETGPPPAMEVAPRRPESQPKMVVVKRTESQPKMVAVKRTESQSKMAAPRPALAGAGASLPRRRVTPPVGALPAVQAPPRPATALGIPPPKTGSAPVADARRDPSTSDDEDRPTMKPVASAVAEARAEGGRDEAETQVSLRPEVAVFDSLIAPPEPVASSNDEPVLRLGTPLQAITPGLSLKEAIDEILDKPDKRGTRDLGRFPPAPAPLRASPQDVRSDQKAAPTPPAPEPEPRKASPSAAELDDAATGFIPDFVETVRPPPGYVGPSDDAPNGTLMMPRPDRPAIEAREQAPPATTRVAGDAHPLAATAMAFAPPVPVKPAPPPLPPPRPEPPPLPAAFGATLAMGAPPARAPSSVPPQPNFASLGSVPPQRALTPSGISANAAPPLESFAPPAQRASGGSWIVGIMVVFVVLVGVGFAGTYGYIRWQRANATRTTSVPVAKPAPPAPAEPSATSAGSSSPASSSPSPSSSSAPSSSTSAAVPVASASASPVSTPATSEGVAADQGTIKTEGASAGRRIFVDDKTMGQTPESVVVKCGVHQVKIGSSGVARAIDVPCGGSIVVR